MIHISFIDIKMNWKYIIRFLIYVCKGIRATNKKIYYRLGTKTYCPRFCNCPSFLCLKQFILHRTHIVNSSKHVCFCYPWAIIKETIKHNWYWIVEPFYWKISNSYQVFFFSKTIFEKSDLWNIFRSTNLGFNSNYILIKTC